MSARVVAGITILLLFLSVGFIGWYSLHPTLDRLLLMLSGITVMTLVAAIAHCWPDQPPPPLMLV